ncbi:MAG: pyridoxal 5'-phosphate synthase glutaminase subunit PdxT [Chloroflexi bacterium]|nr:pyridoxal 5'-phosphate synthase glutaminase subunit PdxT [Chloroflexota bacterium]
MTKVGVLALQGDFAEHLLVLRRMGVSTSEVRLPADLVQVDGLIIPGGESTTISRLVDVYELRSPLVQRAREGMPLFGTCAGLVMLAREVVKDNSVVPLGLVDIQVQRNAFGRQTDSFEADLPVPAIGPEPFPAVFIRAPIVCQVGERVETMAALEDGRVVAVRQGSFLATAFHPELTQDTRLHRYFVEMVKAFGRGS